MTLLVHTLRCGAPSSRAENFPSPAELGVTVRELRAIRMAVDAKIRHRGRDRAQLRPRQAREGGLDSCLASYYPLLSVL